MLRISAIICFVFLFSSCSNKSDSTLAIFKATEEGFLYSNSVFSNSSTIIYESFVERLLKPATAEQASVWQPKAMLIKEKSASMFRYLDSLIIELKKEAGLRLENMTEVYNEDDVEVVNKFFINKNTGDKLFEKLKKYKNEILAVDPELNKKFGNNSIIVTREFETAGTKQKDFTTTFFNHAPAIAAVAMLRKFQNNVRVLENKLVTYCFNQILSYSGCGFSVFNPIIGQSSTYVKGGDIIEITAGIGSFSATASPQITIDNKKVEINESAVAIYKLTAASKAGKYLVPVVIEFIKPDGAKGTFSTKLEYKVKE